MLTNLLLILALTSSSETEVSFKGAGGMTLKGTLSLPDQQKGKVPAVLLLPGSGPTDRQGNQPPLLVTDLLKQLAADLAQNGVASLRFDKRAAHVYSAGWPKESAAINEFFSWENFVADAAAALELLRSRSEVAPESVGVLGHSEGGAIALQLGADLPKGKKPDFMILAGAAGRNMADIIREQISNALKSQAAPPPVYDQYMAAVELNLKRIREVGKVADDVPAGLKPLFNPTVEKLLQSYMRLDPPTMAQSYPGPVLILNGEKDIQISAERDAPVLLKAFEARVSGSVKMVIIRGASHNFKLSEPPGFAGTVAPDALKAIRDFIKDQRPGSSNSAIVRH